MVTDSVTMIQLNLNGQYISIHKKITLSIVDKIIIQDYKKIKNKNIKLTLGKNDLNQTLGKNTRIVY